AHARALGAEELRSRRATAPRVRATAPRVRTTAPPGPLAAQFECAFSGARLRGACFHARDFAVARFAVTRFAPARFAVARLGVARFAFGFAPARLAFGFAPRAPGRESSFCKRSASRRTFVLSLPRPRLASR